MKGGLDFFLLRPRVSLSIAGLLALTGVFAWLYMPRLEDPEMSDRWAMVITPYPGADPERVERMVLEPIESELAEVAELKRIDSTARAGFALITLELRDAVDVEGIDGIWDRVEKSLARARRRFPEGAGEPVLDRNVSDPEAIVLAITGGDAKTLRLAADKVERALLGIPDVSRVTRIGDPGEQVTVELDPAAARRLGITRRMLAGVLSSRHSTIPAGLLDLDGRTASVLPNAEFLSVDEIERTPIPLAQGSAVALGDVARVTLGEKDPASQRMRHQRTLALGLGIVPNTPLDLVVFGEGVREKLAGLRKELAPLEIHEVAFQPAYVESRLDDLANELLQSVVGVCLMLLLLMGLRIGLVVSLVLPLVGLASLAVYAWMGGVLHQMSIAALVIAIGILVDSATVIAEDVQSRLDAGATHLDAMRGAVASLAVPLGSATGTTGAAFIPMLMADGPVAEFTRALPVVIIITLLFSYVFALFVTPALTVLLKPKKHSEDDWMTRMGRVLGVFAIKRKRTVLFGATLAVAGSIIALPYVEQDFFPHGDRATLVVDLSLPEGSDIDRIDALSGKLEHALEAHADVTSVTAFIGRGSPHFYYNLWTFPESPQKAQLVVQTRDTDSVSTVQAFVRDYARRELLAVSVAAKKLEQGPGIAAPVEVRVYADDLVDMARATELVLREVSTVQGTADVRETLGTGVPALRIDVDDATAARHHLSRTDVVIALLGQTHGLEVAQLRSGDEPVPVLVRSPSGRHTNPSLLDSTDVALDAPGSEVPLADVANARTAFLPAAIRHRDRQRMTTVLAELRDDATYTSVMRQLEPRLKALKLPSGVRLEFGGIGEGSSEANGALLLTLPIGFLLLVAFLLLEFNSFRRVAIILTTIPLAATGVVPGLILGHQPFGFMSMLGVTALAGVVVSNAIVLLDLADKLRNEGASLEDAIREAVRARTRPILLTQGTTIVGLIPLAISKSSLWPPLAWAMISGLTASTMLTLLVVPALYVYALRLGPKRASAAA
jgi:multidrug efflux pump subunit AcrB